MTAIQLYTTLVQQDQRLSAEQKQALLSSPILRLQGYIMEDMLQRKVDACIQAADALAKSERLTLDQREKLSIAINHAEVSIL
jgi:hypothetical protein